MKIRKREKRESGSEAPTSGGASARVPAPVASLLPFSFSFRAVGSDLPVLSDILSVLG